MGSLARRGCAHLGYRTCADRGLVEFLEHLIEGPFEDALNDALGVRERMRLATGVKGTQTVA